MKKVFKINPSAAKQLLYNIQPNKPIKIMVQDANRILDSGKPKAK
jgi:hypothetical protein